MNGMTEVPGAVRKGEVEVKSGGCLHQRREHGRGVVLVHSCSGPWLGRAALVTKLSQILRSVPYRASLSERWPCDYLHLRTKLVFSCVRVLCRGAVERRWRWWRRALAFAIGAQLNRTTAS